MVGGRPTKCLPSLSKKETQKAQDRLRRKVKRLEADLGYSSFALEQIESVRRERLGDEIQSGETRLTRGVFRPLPVHQKLRTSSLVGIGSPRERGHTIECGNLALAPPMSVSRKRRCDDSDGYPSLAKSQSTPLTGSLLKQAQRCPLPTSRDRGESTVGGNPAKRSSRLVAINHRGSAFAQDMALKAEEEKSFKIPYATAGAYCPENIFFPAVGYVVGETVDRLVDDDVVSEATSRQIRVLLAEKNDEIYRLLRIYEEEQNTERGVRDFLHALDGVLVRHGMVRKKESVAPSGSIDEQSVKDEILIQGNDLQQRERKLLGIEQQTPITGIGFQSSGHFGGGASAGGAEGRNEKWLCNSRLTIAKPCDPILRKIGPKLGSSRRILTLRNPPNASKILEKVKQGLDDRAELRPAALLVGSGTFNPVHKLHLRRFYLARHFLEEHIGMKVIGGIVSPSHPTLVRQRYRVKAAEIIPPKHRLSMTRAAVGENSWLTVDPWEITRRRIMDYMSVLEHVRDVFHENFPGHMGNVTILYLCPAYQVLKLNPALLRAGGFGVITVCRPLERERLLKELSPNFRKIAHVVEDLAILSAELEKTSSTAVRACLKQGKPVEGMVGFAVTRYMHENNIASKISGKERWSNEDRAFEFEREDKEDRPYHNLPPQHVRRASQMPLQH